MAQTSLSAKTLDLDLTKEVDRIGEWMRNTLANVLHKRGVVLGLSGGIDSSVSCALAVRALGTKRVFGILMPEHDSSHLSADRGELLAKHQGVEYRLEHIGETLKAIGCYRWRDEAIQRLFPEYTPEWKLKIAIAGGAAGGVNFFKLVVQNPKGEIFEQRLPLKEYLQIVASTNNKQRIRKAVEYFHADRLNYAVIGTPNRLEYDQGFFVKNGDGAADLKPIAHLYKTQVYALARHLGLPEEICTAAPTTDTYSMAQGQDEFYFALPYDRMDIALWGYNHKVPVEHVAEYLGLTEDQAKFIYNDIEAKRRTTHYLHANPVLVEPIPEIHR
jgi:NAD+ synthase